MTADELADALVRLIRDWDATYLPGDNLALIPRDDVIDAIGDIQRAAER